MLYKMNPIQFKSVLALTSKERLEHFISKVADWEQLWILRNEEGTPFTRKTSQGVEYLTVWSHPESGVLLK